MEKRNYFFCACYSETESEFFFCNTVPQQPNNIVQVQLYNTVWCVVPYCLLLTCRKTADFIINQMDFKTMLVHNINLIV